MSFGLSTEFNKRLVKRIFRKYCIEENRKITEKSKLLIKILFRKLLQILTVAVHQVRKMGFSAFLTVEQHLGLVPHTSVPRILPRMVQTRSPVMKKHAGPQKLPSVYVSSINTLIINDKQI